MHVFFACPWERASRGASSRSADRVENGGALTLAESLDAPVLRDAGRNEQLGDAFQL
jgi:hypothetical protein